MNWCPINEEINNSYTSLLNAKLSNVWICGFIYHTLTLFGIFVIKITNYVTLIIKDMRYLSLPDLVLLPRNRIMRIHIPTFYIVI